MSPGASDNVITVGAAKQGDLDRVGDMDTTVPENRLDYSHWPPGSPDSDEFGRDFNSVRLITAQRNKMHCNCPNQEKQLGGFQYKAKCSANKMSSEICAEISEQDMPGIREELPYRETYNKCGDYVRKVEIDSL